MGRDRSSIAPAQGNPPQPEGTFRPFHLDLQAPIDRWDEAIPLGNGLTGGLLWGGGSALNLSLDRGDLWDLRPDPTFSDPSFDYRIVREFVNSGRSDELHSRYAKRSPHPTKLPVGRLVLNLGELATARSFHLDMKRAMGIVDLGGTAMECFFAATEPVAMLSAPQAPRYLNIQGSEAVEALGYRKPETGGDSRSSWLLQEAAEGLRFAAHAEIVELPERAIISLSISRSQDGSNPLAQARQMVRKSLEMGYDAVLQDHLKWWSEFWGRSSVDCPDPRVQQHYNLVQYFYGAASRRGAPPMPLQGVWTADEGKLPPWHGDYHHDLNTELTYWAYLGSGRWEEGMSFMDFMWSLKERHEAFARDFFGLRRGHVVPGVMALDGSPMDTWLQYVLSPTTGAWIGHAFFQHWRYTMDLEFLERRAYPYCVSVAEALLELLEPDSLSGKLRLPLSTSPEVHGNSQRAWLSPNSNYDLSLIRWLFAANAEMAGALKRRDDRDRWLGLLERMDDMALDGSGGLAVSPDESLPSSHRHHSHLMSIHPLGISLDGGAEQEGIIKASLARIEKLGTQEWCGYSFSWMACIRARAGDGDGALRYLGDYVDAFTLRNGFHCNGDQTARNLSNLHYRPFTLEGNFAAGQAVHEMLLQGWGDRVRVFPALPSGWGDVSFDRLRAEGGFTVSARRRKGVTVMVRIVASRDGVLRLVNPFGGSGFTSDRQYCQRGDELQLELGAGESVMMKVGSGQEEAGGGD